MIEKYCNACNIDKELYAWLNNKPDNALLGRIHSIYERAVNIISDDKEQLLSVALQETVQAPMMIKMCAAGLEDLKNSVQIGSNVFKCGKGAIKTGNITIDYSKAEIWSKKISGQTSDCKINEKNLMKISDFLLKNGRDSGLLSAWRSYLEGSALPAEDNVYAKFFLDRLHEVSSAVDEKNEVNFIKAIYRLSGFGIGLTPSGDDFILGLLSSFMYYGLNFHEVLVKDGWIYKLKKLTTAVSYFMLKNCIYGYVNDGLIRLLEYGDDDSGIESVMNEVLNIGSTSGTDMIIGVIFARRQLLLKYRKDKEEQSWLQKY